MVEHKRGGDVTKNFIVIIHDVDCHWSRGEEDDGFDQSLNLQQQLFPLRTTEISCMIENCVLDRNTHVIQPLSRFPTENSENLDVGCFRWPNLALRTS